MTPSTSARNQPCACGSGRRYKHCCGALGATGSVQAPAPPPVADNSPSPYDRHGRFLAEHKGRAMAGFCQAEPAGQAAGLAWAPPGLLVVENWLHRDTCRRWREVFGRQQTTPATVMDRTRTNPDGSPVYKVDQQRITEFVPKAELEDEVLHTLQGACRDVVAPHYGRALDWMSYPGVLKYRPGGEYRLHADSERWDAASQRWLRTLDRDYSLLLYLNDEFKGGQLYFWNFDLRLTPAPGMLVVFPSDHRYMHEAEPVTAGERYAIACWARASGTPRITPPAPGDTRL